MSDFGGLAFGRDAGEFNQMGKIYYIILFAEILIRKKVYLYKSMGTLMRSI